MQTQLNHTLFDCMLFTQLAHFKSHEISLQKDRSIGEIYAATPQSWNSSPIFLRYTWYFIDTQLICDVNITYGYVFTNLKALGYYSTHPSDVEVYWKVTGVLPIWFPVCSWKVMNLLIFRHHNKYTHPVLYMPANIINTGHGRVKTWVKLLYTDLFHVCTG